jgi:alpha-tubulin suppressor-like RCC1 family protein
LTADGHVYAWGLNSSGQLGDGTTTNATTPVEVKGPGGTGFLSTVVSIAGGDYHSLAVTADGHAYTWGYNASGQLGDGTTTSATTPVEVKGPGGTGFLSTVVSVAGGASHSLAVASDGHAYAWGYNGYGQLGNGSNVSATTPVEVKGIGGTGFLSNIVAISAGYHFSLALTQGGQVDAWGDNANGELGNGSTTRTLTPVAVKGPGGTGVLSNVRSISAGYYFSLAVTNDGLVSTWGQNNDGQLGNGSTSDSSTPVAATGLAYVSTAAAGAYQALGVGG